MEPRNIFGDKQDLAKIAHGAQLINPSNDSDTEAPDSIFHRKRFTLELNYAYISGLQTLNCAIQSTLIGKKAQDVPEGFKKLNELFQILTVAWNTLIQQEQGLRKVSPVDPQERYKIGLEICHLMKKQMSFQNRAAEVTIVDRYFESKVAGFGVDEEKKTDAEKSED